MSDQEIDAYRQHLKDQYTDAMKQSDADAVGWFFPDGVPVGEWVVICTNPDCRRCGRNPETQTCWFCGSPMMRTIDFLREQKEGQGAG